MTQEQEISGKMHDSKQDGGTSGKSVDQIGERGALGDIDNGMRCLLVYRATLMALNYAMAADNSTVFDTELGRRVVQVI